jgi:DNA-binding NarL/FixJ family response regulator
VLKESAGIEVVNAVHAVHSGHHYLSQKLSDQLIDDYLHQIKASGEKDPLDRLSPREKEVLQLVVEGKSSAEIAATLSLSIKTVETYRSRIFQKLDIDDLPSLVKFAIQHGLTSLDY